MSDAEKPDAEVPAETAADTSAAAAFALGRKSVRRRAQGSSASDARLDAFLEKQGRLVDLQTEHLHEQRAVVLSRLRLGRIADRLRILLQAMTALTGLAIVLILAVMAWRAHADHGLVVQPFSVPPDLAQRGLTGEVVAARLIDRLSQMQAETVTGRPAASYADDWGQDLKVEIPETGVSIDDLDRWLRKALGHETVISGEVYRTPAGIVVAARAGTSPATAHAGADADLDDLIRQAAEDVYASTQPYRYAMWLTEKDPAQHALDLERLARSGDRTDRMWAYVGLSASDLLHGDFAGVIEAASDSLAIDPRFWIGRSDRGEALTAIGHDEAALADLEQANELIHRYGVRYTNPDYLPFDVATSEAWLAAATGDFGEAVRANQRADAARPAATGAPDANPPAPPAGPNEPTGFQQWLADVFLPFDLAGLHEVTAARQVEEKMLPPAGFDRVWAVVHNRAALDATLSQEQQDWPALWKGYLGIDQSQASAGVRTLIATQVTPRAALARAELGDVAGAEALIATTPLDCYLCLRARGWIAAAAHDWAGADRWFAEAVSQGPSLPFAYAEWGRALLARGDAAGAVAKLRLACQKGPHFADPLETWGEALMAERDDAGAVAKFAEADKDAPRWGRNHMMWGEALARLGRTAEARAQYQAAAGMDLGAADRATLTGLMQRP